MEFSNFKQGAQAMSTSLLYRAWGIRGYRYVRTNYPEGGIEFVIEQDPKSLECGHCGSRRIMRQGQVSRRFKTTPVGGKPVSVVLPIPRLWCAECSTTRQAKVAFADERRSYTRTFERYALELCRHMTIRAVARHLGVGWDMIKDMQKRYLKKHFGRPRLKDLREIAIDEISIGKGHHYLTVVLDLATGAVVFIGEGKGADSLKPFWKRLLCATRGRPKIKAVATDMSAAYTFAIAERLPNAVHVFDRFHVVKLYNEKLTDLRREVQRTTENVEHKKLLKGTHWLLVKNPENLEDGRKERERLEEALRINQPLATAYYMKEDLREFWGQGSKRNAKKFLDDWIRRAEASGIRMLKQFANTLRLHRKGLLAWYEYPISTGPLEGTNNKIKTLQRQAYGYRDQEFFRLRIFSAHTTHYELIG